MKLSNEEKTESKINYDSKESGPQCRGLSEDDLSYRSVKHVLDTKHIECTICNKMSKTNWSKHKKTPIHM